MKRIHQKLITTAIALQDCNMEQFQEGTFPLIVIALLLKDLQGILNFTASLDIVALADVQLGQVIQRNCLFKGKTVQNGQFPRLF